MMHDRSGWRRQCPSACGNEQQVKALLDGTIQVFSLVKGTTWSGEQDQEYRERDEWAGPVVDRSFEIKLQYHFPENLLITDPKLTIFQIHSYNGDVSKHPMLMVNMLRKDNNICDGGVCLDDPTVYMKIWFRDPNDHSNAKINEDWKPKISANSNSGSLKDVSNLTVWAKIERCDN